jgi:hypothetical protein
MLLYKENNNNVKCVEDNEDIVFHLMDGWNKLSDDIPLSYKYAYKQKTRIPELEPFIMKHLMYALCYTMHIIKGRWVDAEKVIMKNPGIAYDYAYEVIKGRWPEAEPSIMQNAAFAYYYTKNIIKSRWIDAEPFIMLNPEFAYYYARDIIKGRWIEAEKCIMDTVYKQLYIVDCYNIDIKSK